MTDPHRGAQNLETFARSHLFRVLALATLILVLQIPVGMVGNLIEERQLRRDQTIGEVTGKWGGHQQVIGPLLTVPYEVHRVETRADGSTHTHKRIRHATFLAESLAIDGDVRGEVRERGIFEVPLYDATLSLSGTFAPPDFTPFEVSPEQVHWDRAVLSVQIADARAIQEAVTLGWGGREIAFEPGLGDGATAGSSLGGPATGIHVRLPDLLDVAAADFSLTLRLHGSGSLAFAPLGRETDVALRSDWPHPSFQGAWLPQSHEIAGDGFSARWKVPYLGRGFPQAWLSDASPGEVVSASRFGVSFVTPVDPYRISQRAAKYDLLFLGLTFLALWLFEVLAGVRVHAVQYLLVGGAMSLFYLLLLAFSEHIGVGAAYAIAAVGIVALIAGYAVSVLRQRRRGAAIGGVVAALYGYLYVLLHNEDHALLVGSVGLFAVLAGVMWLTRRVDWFARVPFGERSDGEATA